MELDFNEEDLQLPIFPSSLAHIPPDRANLVDQTDPEKLISEIKHILKGEERNEDGEWYMPEDSQPLLTDIGIQELAMFLRMIINKNTIFTIYSKDEVRRVLIDVERDIIEHLRANARRYNITPEKFIMICNMIIHPVETAIKRSEEGITMDFIGRTTRDVNTSQMSIRPPVQPEPDMPLKRLLKRFIPFR